MWIMTAVVVELVIKKNNNKSYQVEKFFKCWHLIGSGFKRERTQTTSF